MFAIRRQRGKIGWVAAVLMTGSINGILGCSLVLTFMHMAVLPSHCAQTRELCDKCCRESGFDDYFLEQCKLRCFRNPDHCTGKKSTNVPAAVPQEAPRSGTSQQRVIPPSQGSVPTFQGPASQPSDAPSRASRPPKAEATFRWPESLTMVPGKEWEAAGQILMANGITPQHPNFPMAVKEVERVLTDFARRNPTGGELPTDQLERILLQFR